MYETLLDTDDYELITLYRSNLATVRYVKDKENNMYDRIRIVKHKDNEDMTVLSISRFEDEKLFNVLLNTFKEME